MERADIYQIANAANKFAVTGKPWGNQPALIIEALSIFKVLNNEAFP